MIICVGEALIDFVPQGSAAAGHGLPKWKPVAGGSPFNCAVAAARLGADVQFASAVSTDLFGDHIVDRLQNEGVDLSLVSRVKQPSTLAFVRRDAAGTPSYAFYAEGSADRAFTLDMMPPTFPEVGLLQFGSISLIANPAGRAILDLVTREQHNRAVAFDPNIRPNVVTDETDYRSRLDEALAASSILKTSDEDLAWMYPGLPQDEAVHTAMDQGVHVVVLTRGKDGPEAYVGDQKTAVPAVPVEVADTIGAGDSFLAATLVWLDENGVTTPERVNELTIDELKEALVFATRVAAITCSRIGADPPRRSELR